jgi:hypothetical protein
VWLETSRMPWGWLRGQWEASRNVVAPLVGARFKPCFVVIPIPKFSEQAGNPAPHANLNFLTPIYWIYYYLMR